MSISAITPYQLPAVFAQEGIEVQQFAEIDSTNSEAMRQLQSGRKGCFLLLAHAQTAGRGRRGRVWQSPAGAGIYLTLVRPFARATRELQALSLVTALAVHDALRHCGIAGIRLKWPNDLLVDKRKLAGILLELRQSSDTHYVLFGIGINLKLPVDVRAAIDQPVTDLNTLLHCEPDKSRVVAQVIGCLLSNLNEFENTSFESFRTKWNELDCFLGKEIALQLGGTTKIGISQGVDADGALLLRTATELEKINGGEIMPSLMFAEHRFSEELAEK